MTQTPNKVGGTLLFQPSDHSETAIEVFRLKVNATFNLHLNSYEELHDWSCENTEQFWALLWNHLEIVSSQKYSKVVEYLSPMYPPPKWFIGSRLNFAENLIEPFFQLTPNALALIQVDEHGIHTGITFKDLKNLVHKIVIALKSVGVGCGDTVAAYCNNRVEAVAFMLGSTALGACYTASSPDFGPWAVYSRFHQLPQLKCILATAEYRYNGRPYDHTDKLVEFFGFLAKDLITPKKVLNIVLLNGSSGAIQKLSTHSSFQFHLWESFIDRQIAVGELHYEQVPFYHPVYVLYSSGSTGEPKCIVHSVGGTLIQHKKEHCLHSNLKAGNKLLQVTTVAWMMWHWMVSALSLGVTLIIYDASPITPDPMTLWQLLAILEVTHFGTSAKYLSLLEEKSIIVKDKLILGRSESDQSSPLNKLQYIFSTGSPLSARSFDFVYTSIKKDVRLFSITGGTDIISLFAGGNPAGPIYRGEIPVACLGMKLEIYESILNNSEIKGSAKLITERNVAGDLVCTKIFPSAPIYFQGDSVEKSLYKKAYFCTYGTSVWHHGDYITRTNTGGYVMLGRSDGVLNPAGVRFGSAELYTILDKFIPDLIEDSLAVGQNLKSNIHQLGKLTENGKKPCNLAENRIQADSFHSLADERVILFVKLSKELSSERFEELKVQLNATIRAELSPRHVPALIIPVSIIPTTMNGKKAEVVVKKLLNCNNEQSFIEALGKGLQDPDCLNEFLVLKNGLLKLT